MRKHLINRIVALAWFYMQQGRRDLAVSCYDMADRLERATESELWERVPMLLATLRIAEEHMQTAGTA